MASGINSTLRSVGLATGIAALGAIFTAQLRSTVTGRLAGTLDGAPADTSKRVLGMLPPPARLLYQAVWRPGYARTPRWNAATTQTRAERPTR